MRTRKGLAFQQTKISVLIAFGLGTGISLLQIFLDYSSTQSSQQSSIQQIIHMMEKPFADAVEKENTPQLNDLIVGLFKYDPIYSVQVVDRTGQELVSSSRGLLKTERRWISDKIFGQSSGFQIDLNLRATDQLFFDAWAEDQEKADSKNVSRVGTLKVQVDTFYDGVNFLERSGTVLVFGLFRNFLLTFLLLLFFNRFITHPFVKLEQDLSQINPKNPGKHRLETPIGHETNEFGRLVKGANGLLVTIESEIDTRIQKAEEAAILKGEVNERQKREKELKEYQVKLEASNSELAETLENLQKMQQKLISQEKLAYLGTLTAGIAHEIKNPLNFINNFALMNVQNGEDIHEVVDKYRELISDEDREELDEAIERLSESSGIIRKQGIRADKIVKSMLQHSREDDHTFQQTNISDLLEEHCQLALNEKDSNSKEIPFQIHTDYDQNAEEVEMIATDIGRVFLNIIQNSAYALRERHGKEEQFEPQIWLSTKSNAENVEVRIKDNGGGMDTKTLEQVFNPFYTTKPTGSGTGLGMSISYEIIAHQHGGELRVNSIEGESTEFLIILPRYAKKHLNTGGTPS